VELSDEDVLPLSICFCMFFIMSFCMSEVEPDEELDDDEFEDVEFEDVEFEDVDELPPNICFCMLCII